MRQLLEECFESMPPVSVSAVSVPGNYVVLLTGGTGNLGAHVLARLVRSASVAKIISFARGPEAHLAERHQQALAAAGTTSLSPEEWAKIELRSMSRLQQQQQQQQRDAAPADKGLGLASAELADLAAQVTHVVHLAWPMDFQRTLPSFRAHVRLVQTLVDVARKVREVRPLAQRVRLLFASSIAVVRNCRRHHHHPRSSATTVPEAVLEDPLASADMGYAEAKWVCESLLDHVGKTHAAVVEPVVVRVGQLSGPEAADGVWKAAEHMPVLFRASQAIGAFPDIDGTVSWLPVDRAARALLEILLFHDSSDTPLPRFLHLENPVRQPIQDIFVLAGRHFGWPAMRPLEQCDEWLRRAVEAGVLEPHLEGFFKNDFQDLANGGLVLDTTRARALSRTLRGTGAVESDLVVDYLRRWQQDGTLEP